MSSFLVAQVSWQTGCPTDWRNILVCLADKFFTRIMNAVPRTWNVNKVLPLTYEWRQKFSVKKKSVLNSLWRALCSGSLAFATRSRWRADPGRAIRLMSRDFIQKIIRASKKSDQQVSVHTIARVEWGTGGMWMKVCSGSWLMKYGNNRHDFPFQLEFRVGASYDFLSEKSSLNNRHSAWATLIQLPLPLYLRQSGYTILGPTITGLRNDKKSMVFVYVWRIFFFYFSYSNSTFSEKHSK